MKTTVFLFILLSCFIHGASAAPIVQSGHLVMTDDGSTFTFPTASGCKFVYHDDKGAVRFGNDHNSYTNWSNSYIGNLSFAYGYEPKASGLYSTAFGVLTNATGVASFAGGSQSTASGPYSFAFGFSADASGNGIALGEETTATDGLVVVGNRNTIPAAKNFGLGSEYPVFVVGVGDSVLIDPEEYEYEEHWENGLVVYDMGSVAIKGNVEVGGQIQILGGSPGSGKVLTSDGVGLASWQAITSSQWTTSGSNISFTSGSVGIGITAPTAAKLQVSGKILANTAAGTAGGYSFGSDGGFDTGMFSPSDGVIDFYSNGALRMRLEPTGSLGVNGSISANSFWTSSAQFAVGESPTGPRMTLSVASGVRNWSMDNSSGWLRVFSDNLSPTIGGWSIHEVSGRSQMQIEADVVMVTKVQGDISMGAFQ